MIALYSPDIVQEIAAGGFKSDYSQGLESNGWMGVDTTGNYKNIKEVGNKGARNQDSLINKCRVLNFNEICSDLTHFVAALKERKINVVVVSMPMYGTYTKYCNSTILKRNDSVITRLCHEQGCRYFNYCTDNRFVKADFHDNYHLNFIGAEKFSKIIDCEIIKPTLTK